jgi:hypothetical protein
MVAMKYNLFARLTVLTALFAAFGSPGLSALIPVSGIAPSAPQSVRAPAAARGVATSIAVAGAFHYSVLQQPSGQPAYVSRQEDSVTQFSMATRYGSQGFLAHNDLAGATFFEVELGDTITVRYSDGTTSVFEVTHIRRLQANQPNSPYSSFADLDNAGETLTAAQLFYETYGVEETLILQTCIAKGAVQSWGRLFIIATPAEVGQLAQ